MKFVKLNTPRGMKPIQAEHSKFTISNLDNGKEAFVDRRPRNDSKYWSYHYLVWDNQRNCKA